MIVPSTPPSFGERVKHQRRLLDLTQAELAKRVGCARVTIHKIESDDLRPSKQLAELLAQALQVTALEREAFVGLARGEQEAGDSPVPAPTGERRSSNLPVSLTSFIGRAEEIAEVKRLLAGTRLLTLTGSGGTGKTRLSLQVAADLVASFPDGVWFVELASLADPILLPHAIASVFGLREEARHPLLVTLTDHLRSKRLLLVLDNCEHLIAACATFAVAALRATQGLQILTTSREALSIAGEAIYRVPSLPTPNPKDSTYLTNIATYDSVRLFVERASAAQSTFRLSHANTPAVAQVCYRLDGIPLAIELAAARIKVLSAEEIARRLDDRFHLLTGGSRTALPRQQTLRSTIDWSYSLLEETERILFRRLSAFGGGWTLEAAEAVCASEEMAREGILDWLTRLVDKSLVVVEASRWGTRYHLLETVREYAQETLRDADESTQLRSQHLQYFLNFATAAEPRLFGKNQKEWFDRLDEDHDNLRTAIAWALQNDMAQNALQLTGALWYFWYVRGYHDEGNARLAAALALPLTSRLAAQRAKALNAAGYLAQLTHMSDTEAKRFAEEALALSTEISDKANMGMALEILGRVAHERREYATARAFFERSLSVHRELADTQGVAWIFGHLGSLARDEGNPPEARRMLEEAVNRSRAAGDTNNLAYALDEMGMVAFQEQHFQEATACLVESLSLNVEVQENRGIAKCLHRLARTAFAEGKWVRATQLYAAQAKLRAAINYPLSEPLNELLDLELGAARTQLGDTFSTAWETGNALTLEQAIALAKETSG